MVGSSFTSLEKEELMYLLKYLALKKTLRIKRGLVLVPSFGCNKIQRKTISVGEMCGFLKIGTGIELTLKSAIN